MAHLPSLQIGNFKVFKEYADFDFAPITVLTGKNSSGKSSLVKAIELLAEHLKVDGEISFDTPMQVSKILPALGNFEKILSHHNPKLKTLHYRFPYLMIDGTEKDMFSIEIVFKLADTETKSGKLEKIVIEKWYDAVEKIDLETTQEIFSVKAVDEFTYDTHIDLDYFFKKYKNMCHNIKMNEEFKPDFLPFYRFDEKLMGHLLFDKNEYFGQFMIEMQELFKEDEILDKGWQEIISEQRDKLRKFGFRIFNNKNGSQPTEEQKQEIKEWIEGELVCMPRWFNNSYKLDTLKVTNSLTNSNLLCYIKDKPVLFFSTYVEEYKMVTNSKAFPLEQIYGITTTSDEDEFSIKTLNNELNDQSLLVYQEYQYLNNIDNSDKNFFYDAKSTINFCNMLKQTTDKADFGFDLPDLFESFNKKYLNTRVDFFLTFFIQENILKNILSDIINPFISTDFISINRNELKRSYKTDDKFGKLLFKVLEKNIEYKNFINKYVKEFEIGESVFVETDKEGEFSRVYLKSKGKEMLLSDVGFGVSQLLPILLKIILIAGKKQKEEGFTLFIEEPESNLHPALQSKLADMFIDAAREFNIHFVIETHSEYLIRRMQLLTANTYATINKKDDFPVLETSDTRIYYFYSPDEIPEGEPQVYPIDIEEDGALTKNFGKGFFDESSNLNYALYQYSKINKN